MKKFLMMGILLLAGAAAHADTVYLKDGQVVQGDILEETPYHVIIKEGLLPKKIDYSQIDRVEKGSGVSSPAALSMDAVDVPEAKRQLIERLITANGSKANMQKHIELIIEKTEPERREALRAMLNVDAILNNVIPVYAKYYTEEELKNIVAFYESPAGKKVVESTPFIIKESMQAMIEQFQAQ